MSAVIVERRGATALLRLNSPANMNAISLALRSGLADELPGLLGDPAVKCLIVTGTGEAFSAGGDIKQMQERGATEVRGRLRHAHKWCRLLLESEKPVIAAVNGAAVGAGFSLALLCDLILISDRGFFRAGFPAVGAAPDLGLAFTLPRITGMMRAKEILMTNRRIEPAEAVSLGLALRQVAQEKLLEEAQILADQIAAGPGDEPRPHQDPPQPRLFHDLRSVPGGRGHGPGHRLRQRGIRRGDRRLPRQAPAGFLEDLGLWIAGDGR